jgi:hypothetical protein
MKTNTARTLAFVACASVLFATAGRAHATCKPEERAQAQKSLVGTWQYYLNRKKMCNGLIFRGNGSFVDFEKDCAMKVLAPDSREYGRWSLDAECKIQLVYNKPTTNLLGQKGRYATMTPTFHGHDRFTFKETYVGEGSYYQRR